MAVTSVNPVWSTAPKGDVKGRREYITLFQVETNDHLDGPITARDATGIPRLDGDTYQFGNDFDDEAYVVEYGVELLDQKGSRKVWYVTVSYSSEPRDFCDTDAVIDPILQRPMISGDFITGKTPVLVDAFDDPVVTSAGEPYDNLTRDDGIDSFTITKNFATIDLKQQREFMNTMNLDLFFGHESGKVKMYRCRWEHVYRG